MNIHFRRVTPADLSKFPIWYEKIGGAELFSNFIPSTFVSFEESKDLLWYIILDKDDEIGTIWFERKDPDRASYDLGVYLNRNDLFGKGIGETVIKSAMDALLSETDVQEFYLDVRKENIRAIRCYKKIGFETFQEGEKSTPTRTIKFKRMRLLIAEPDHRTKQLS